LGFKVVVTQYLACCLLLFGCSPKSIKSEQQKSPLEGSIEQVASQFIHHLYQDKQFRMFRLDLPPSAILADHSTGPRIIVLLTDLNGQRIKDGSSIAAKSNQAFYLTNTFSAGFQNNSAYTASYLVLGLNQSLLSQQTPTCPETGFSSLLENGSVAVCQSLGLQSQVFQGGDRVLVYRQHASQVHAVTPEASVPLAAGDFIFVMVGTD